MQLKTYQQKALERLDLWIATLKESEAKNQKAIKVLEEKGLDILNELKNHPRSAWQTLETQPYISRTAASGEPIPHVCMKIPTGGGKTLLGVSALERLKRDRGLVLWIVPTKAIYDQTFAAFRNREHPYRETLERTSGGRVKLLEKDERFTKRDIEDRLCVMMLSFSAANRNKNKEFLRIFRNSGGYESFFPERDDHGANKRFAERFPDLEKEDGLVKHSLVNVLKTLRPTVVLDEAHKAYGKDDTKNKEFVKSVNRLNPGFVLELSATPKDGISNMLVNISGPELKEEEMIKLPIEIKSLGNSDWKSTLAGAKDKLDELEEEAGKLQRGENRHIRPIALVRVERTGANQRDGKHVHTEDAREYLIQTLAVPEEQVRIQASKRKDLRNEDLLSETSQVRWIITQDALKEGWDCSFAYILALLDNTSAKTALTQMVGRVMRQPHARVVPGHGALNRCYVFCYNKNVGDAVKWVKEGLEKEGLAGLGGSVVPAGEETAAGTREVWRRKPYRKLKIFLPQVLHKDGKEWRPIDYDRDILGSLDWETVGAGGKVRLDGGGMTERTAAVDIHGNAEISETEVDAGEKATLEYFARRLGGLVPNPWRAGKIAENFLMKYGRNWRDNPKIPRNRIYLSEEIARRVREKIDGEAENVFREKVRRDEIRFSLVTDEKLNYELRQPVVVPVPENETELKRKNGRPVQQSLFECVYDSDFNNLEKNFALYLEGNETIFWWHRIAARREYFIQGWRRHKVFPDFVACKRDDGKLLILETKGVHLKGNEDTEYKRKLLKTLETTYREALERGEMEVIGETPATFRMLIENDWEGRMGEIIAEG